MPDHKSKKTKAQGSISPFQGNNISYDWRKLQIAEAWNSFQASEKNGAGEEIRTLDIDLGKVALYHWATPATLVPLRPCVRPVFAIRIESGQEFFKRIFRIIFESSFTDLKINPLLSKAIDCVLFTIFFKRQISQHPIFLIVFILFGFLTLRKPICG